MVVKHAHITDNSYIGLRVVEFHMVVKLFRQKLRHGKSLRVVEFHAMQDSKNKILHVESTYFNTNKKAIPRSRMCQAPSARRPKRSLGSGLITVYLILS